VEIDYPGYEAYVTSVYVDSGGSNQIDATLVPLQSYGSVLVQSTPTGADVYIDGNYEGISPVTVSGLSQGPHMAELHLAGYEVLTQTINIVSGQGANVNMVLSPYSTESDTGSIDIRSNIPGALVYLDGVYKGATLSGTVFNLIAVSPGSHTILLHVPGYTDFIKTTQVTAGQIAHFDATFTQQSSPYPGAPLQVSGNTAQDQQIGSIIVSSVPSGGQVSLDGQFRGVAPVTIYNVAPGNHIVNLDLAGYDDWSSSVQVLAGQSVQVSASMTKGTSTRSTSAPLPFYSIFAALAVAILVVSIRARK
jgi:hypothetical protein